MSSHLYKYGNSYLFPEVSSSAAILCEFDRPIKRFKITEGEKLYITNEANETGNTIANGIPFEFPNIKGYPNKIWIGTNSNTDEVPGLFIEEYGDVVNYNYFNEEG